jgi:hypothetical protein
MLILSFICYKIDISKRNVNKRLQVQEILTVFLEHPIMVIHALTTMSTSVTYLLLYSL